MAQSELDNFFTKFKNLLHSGSDATLTVKSEAGKASVTLHLNPSHVVHPHDDHPHRRREGQTRQRHHLRRAASREAAATTVKVSETINPESDVVAVDKSADASEAFEEAFVDNTDEAVEPVKYDKHCDEFCPDMEYINDKNSVRFRFGILDPAIYLNIMSRRPNQA